VLCDKIGLNYVFIKITEGHNSYKNMLLTTLALLTENQQREFASVQILLKKRNTDVAYMPFIDDLRSWKDIGASAFE
jgi:hypothetical protein